MDTTTHQTHGSVIAAVTVAASLLFPTELIGANDGGRRASMNGFDLSYSHIPRKEIMAGGVPRDGIPALTHPPVLHPERANYLRPDDLVSGVVFGDQARAYPLRILVWHENVNDTVGGIPIAVTYCPLCRSTLIFDRRVGGRVLEFGISGLLWNSNVLLYDRQPQRSGESLWSQVLMRAVSGPAAQKGLAFRLLPSELATWSNWLRKHPNTTVLSDQTGYSRNYSASPYKGYFVTDRLAYPVRQRLARPQRFRNKEPMVVVFTGNAAKAYAVRDVAQVVGKRGSVKDRIGNERVRLTYLPESESVRVELLGRKNGGVPVAYMYWFALSAILPELAVFDPTRWRG